MRELRHEIDRRLRAAIAPFLCVCALVYFGYHSIQGDRGLIALTRLSEEAERARIALAEVRSERQRLEHRVSLLHPDHVDLDMLDEQVRREIGLVHPDDLVIKLDN